MKKEIFKNFSLSMFRQWFGEEKKDKVYTAGEVWEMLNQASPLFPNEKQTKELSKISKDLIKVWLDNDDKELPWIPFVPIDYEELIKFMKPSERIKQIHKTQEGNFRHTETSAILAYLDEQWNKENQEEEYKF